MSVTRVPAEQLTIRAALPVDVGSAHAFHDAMLDAPARPAFEHLVRLIRTALRVPVALITLVESDRQVFAAQCGLPEPWASAGQTPLSHSFCQHVVARGEPLIIRDARLDSRVRDNLAVPDLGVVAYCGVPLVDDGGATLGSVCAIDTRPRDWTDDDLALLRTVSAQATAEVQLRAQSLQLAEDLDRQRALAADRQTMVRLNVHDLRTPLTAMLLGLEVLPRLGPLNDKQANYLGLAKRNGQALVTMINHLLDIGTVEHRGGEALHLAPCPLRHVVDQAIEQVQDLAAEKQIAIGCDVDGLPSLRADGDKLVRVLVNLLGNAVKFTREGGRVTVRARPTRDDDGWVQLSIEDTGIGMADGSRIFEEGVRLDASATTRRSTGLGLTFCKRIVEAHGGRIWFDTTPGVGSTFHLTLPVA